MDFRRKAQPHIRLHQHSPSKLETKWGRFLDYVENVRKMYDSATYTAKCSHCGALILPPRCLILYVEIEFIVRWLIAAMILRFLLSFDLWFVLQLAFWGIAMLCIHFIIPAVLASACQWKEATFSGTQDDFMKNRQKQVGKYLPLFYTCWVISIILTSIAFASLHSYAN